MAAEEVRFELIPRGEASAELVGAMLALYARAFARWPSLDPGVPLADHLRWKMESPGCPSAAIVGWLGSRLVTARVVVLHHVRVGGEPKEVLDSPDLAVDPDFQGRGISTAFNRWRDAWVSTRCDFEIDDASNERLARSHHRRGERPIANRLRVLYAVPDASRLPRDLLRPRGAPPFAVRFAWRALAAASRLRGVLRRTHRHAGPIRTVTRFDERADVFFERAAAPFDLIYAADHRRLNWRYCDRRAGPFVVRVVEEAGAMAAYAVHRVGGPHGHLVDLLVLPGRSDLAEALARDAVAGLLASGAVDVSSWLPHHHPYRAALRRVGFVTLPQPIPQRYRVHRMPRAELSFFDRLDARLHLTMGSTDFV